MKWAMEGIVTRPDPRSQISDPRSQGEPHHIWDLGSEIWIVCGIMSAIFAIMELTMIRVQNLVKRFGEITAVDNVSFEVQRGEIFAFLGPNGAGKTTTIKMLTTLLKPTSGALSLDGIDPAVDEHGVRQCFGIVFQDPSLDDELTAYENMDFHGVLYKVPRRLRASRIEMLLRLFELWDRRDDQAK